MNLAVRAALTWASNLLALAVASRLIDSIDFTGFGAVALSAAVFGIVNLVVKPFLTIVGCVLIIATLGVALFFINMACLALTAWLVGGFEVGGFWSVAGATVIVWLVNLTVQLLIDRAGGTRRWSMSRR